MSTAGRTLLLFFLAWAAFWGTPASFARQEGAPVRLVSPEAGAGMVLETTAAAPSSGARPGFAPPPMHREVSEEASEPLPSDDLGRASAKGHGSPPFSRRAALARAGTSPALPSDILLLIQRQNE